MNLLRFQMTVELFFYGVGSVRWVVIDFDKRKPVLLTMCACRRVFFRFDRSLLALTNDWFRRRRCHGDSFFGVVVNDDDHHHGTSGLFNVKGLWLNPSLGSWLMTQASLSTFSSELITFPCTFFEPPRSNSSNTLNRYRRDPWSPPLKHNAKTVSSTNSQGQDSFRGLAVGNWNSSSGQPLTEALPWIFITQMLSSRDRDSFFFGRSVVGNPAFIDYRWGEETRGQDSFDTEIGSRTLDNISSWYYSVPFPQNALFGPESHVQFSPAENVTHMHALSWYDSSLGQKLYRIDPLPLEWGWPSYGLF